MVAWTVIKRLVVDNVARVYNITLIPACLNIANNEDSHIYKEPCNIYHKMGQVYRLILLRERCSQTLQCNIYKYLLLHIQSNTISRSLCDLHVTPIQNMISSQEDNYKAPILWHCSCFTSLKKKTDFCKHHIALVVGYKLPLISVPTFFIYAP